MQASIAFTLVTLTSCIFTTLMTLAMTIILVRHLRRERDVGLLLILNTYVIMFVFTVCSPVDDDGQCFASGSGRCRRPQRFQHGSVAAVKACYWLKHLDAVT